MLPKKKRLKTSDFKEFRGARTSHSSHLIFRSKEGGPVLRTAAVVSTTVAKTAVARNLLRRRIYEVVGVTKSPSKGGILTITAKKGAPTLSFAELRQEIEEMLKRL